MTNDWRSYPFQLVPGDSQLDFPAAEGEHPDQESDTWFIAGQLDARRDRPVICLPDHLQQEPARGDGGRGFLHDGAVRPATPVNTAPTPTTTCHRPTWNRERRASCRWPRATSTSATRAAPAPRRGPPAATATENCCPTPTASAWWARITPVGRMRLDLAVTPTRAPTPVGASTYNGKIACFGQPDTYSYFQTGMAMTGTLRWGESVEQVSGSAGHVDRQWFPKYAGGGGTGGDPRARSHEWRTINFDNGVDMSIWRQFDRTNGNALQPFTGVTVELPRPGSDRPSRHSAPRTSRSRSAATSGGRIRYGRWCVRWLPPGTCPIVTGSPAPHCNWISSGSRWWRLRRTACRSNTWKVRTATAERCGANR